MLSVQARVLTGADDVDSWSTQSAWDNYLNGVRVVVSTYQVLLDALLHGFVKMDDLALIVFDEGIPSSLPLGGLC
jgi:ERCC4-related helicase